MLIGMEAIRESLDDMTKARLIGINHVALEVGDLDEALAFYASFLDFELRGRVRGMAFLDAGDQFIALSEGRRQGPDDERHFGLVVDDVDAVRASGIPPEPGRGLRVRDPWGNIVELVDYREIQFTKAPAVLAGMGLAGLEKTGAARRELAEKGLG
jgi:catechol 2,3-dioxygenase-like lactoylglutathione lyase family enzyme